MTSDWDLHTIHPSGNFNAFLYRPLVLGSIPLVGPNNTKIRCNVYYPRSVKELASIAHKFRSVSIVGVNTCCSRSSQSKTKGFDYDIKRRTEVLTIATQTKHDDCEAAFDVMLLHASTFAFQDNAGSIGSIGFIKLLMRSANVTKISFDEHDKSAVQSLCSERCAEPYLDLYGFVDIRRSIASLACTDGSTQGLSLQRAYSRFAQFTITREYADFDWSTKGELSDNHIVYCAKHAIANLLLHSTLQRIFRAGMHTMGDDAPWIEPIESFSASKRKKDTDSLLEPPPTMSVSMATDEDTAFGFSLLVMDKLLPDVEATWIKFDSMPKDLKKMVSFVMNSCGEVVQSPVPLEQKRTIVELAIRSYFCDFIRKE